MKRLPLLLFSSVIFSFGEAQTISNTENVKWTIAPNGQKVATGRLLINPPAGTKWTIYIYKMADEKYVTSFNQTNNKGSFVLQPGEYKITLNLAPVLNVSIRKGHDTKLKTGELIITDNDVWYLYDESGQTYLTSGNKPEKIALPIGTYTYAMGDVKKLVEVKEAGWAKGERMVMETDQWVIDTVSSTYSVSEGEGRIQTNWGPCNGNSPVSTFWILNLYWDNKTTGRNCAGEAGTRPFLEVDARNYNMKFNEITIDNVPVVSKHQTRIKTGWVTMRDFSTPLVDEFWQLWDSTGKTYYKLNPYDPRPYSIFENMAIPMPVRSYRVWASHEGKASCFLVKLEDKKTIDAQQLVREAIPIETNHWVLNRLKNQRPIPELVVDFPNDAKWSIKITSDRITKPRLNFNFNNNTLPKGNLQLAEGKYNVEFSGVMIKDVWIKNGHATKLKTGIVEIASQGSWTLQTDYSLAPFLTGTGPARLILLANKFEPNEHFRVYEAYRLVVGTSVHTVLLKEGETLRF